MINIRIMDYCDMISLHFDRHHVCISVSEELAASILRVRNSLFHRKWLQQATLKCVTKVYGVTSQNDYKLAVNTSSCRSFVFSS